MWQMTPSKNAFVLNTDYRMRNLPFSVKQSSVIQALHFRLVCGKSTKTKSGMLIPGQGDYVLPKCTFDCKMDLCMCLGWLPLRLQSKHYRQDLNDNIKLHQQEIS